MRIDAHEQRPVDALLLAVLTQRLGNRQHVVLVETAFEGRTAVPGRAKRDLLVRVCWVRVIKVISRNQAWNIDEQLPWGRLAGQIFFFHFYFSLMACPPNWLRISASSLAA